MSATKPHYGSPAWLEKAIAEQQAWIKSCGGDLAGYIANYGDPGVPRSGKNEGKPMAGHGGTLIYAADTAWLAKLENDLKSKTHGGYKPSHEKGKTWLVMIIDEPFPVLISHVTYNKDTYHGPYYAPGSRWYFHPNDLVHYHSVVRFWQRNGYTVTTAQEVR